MIFSGGENAYSVELGVAVMTKQGFAISKAELQLVCSRVAAHKRPKRFVLLNELPNNSFGNMQRASWRSALAGRS